MTDVFYSETARQGFSTREAVMAEKTYTITCALCGEEFTALTWKAKYCEACRVSKWRSSNYRRRGKRAKTIKPPQPPEPMTEAVCPKCGEKHMVPERRVNMRDKKHYIYCNKCAYLRDHHEVKPVTIHF
jgi:transcription elongation factor Elf1